jgi:hypothetical protein
MLGIDLPLHDIDPTSIRAIISELKASPIRSRFHRIDAPMHLCVVEMRLSDLSVHVGVYLDTEDGPRVLHCREGSGTVCEPLNTIPFELRFWCHG